MTRSLKIILLLGALALPSQAQEFPGYIDVTGGGGRSGKHPTAPQARPSPRPTGPPTLQAEAQAGNLNEVKARIELQGASPNSADADGNTPLHLAAWKGQMAVVQYLVEKGANVNALEKRYCTPMILAAGSGHLEVVQFLIAKGAEVNVKQQDGGTALHRAAAGGYAEIVRVLLEAGADASLKDHSGRTPLALATKYKQGQWEKVVSLLKEKGAQE